MTYSHLKDPRRNTVITASVSYDAIYSRNPLWETWTGRRERFKGNQMTQWGNDHEDDAIAELEKFTNSFCVPSKKFLVHDSLPIGATPDGFIDGIPVEVKCPWTQKIYPTIPERYWFQMQLQMSVVKQKQCYFMIWTPQDFKVQMVDYDQDFIDWYIPYAKQFLECVANDTRPERWSKRPIYNHKEK